VLVIFPLGGPVVSAPLADRPADWVEEHVLDDQADPRGAADELRARKSALMTDLLVVIGQRRKGIGRVLVQDAIEVARVSGAAELSLYVAKDNLPARRLYEELGFTPARDAIGQMRYSLPLSSMMSGA
jgi:GNAT superfamily N-acetyltransferase